MQRLLQVSAVNCSAVQRFVCLSHSFVDIWKCRKPGCMLYDWTDDACRSQIEIVGSCMDISGDTLCAFCKQSHKQQHVCVP